MKNSNPNARNNANVAHNWAHNTGRIHNGSNFYYTPDNGVIYSYGSHFPICRNIDNSVYLFSTRKWGNATAKHIGATVRAIPTGAKVINMYYIPTGWNLIDPEYLHNVDGRNSYTISELHMQNVAHWEESLNNTKKLFDKARNKTKYIRIIQEVFTQLAEYNKYFNLDYASNAMYSGIRSFIAEWDKLEVWKIIHSEEEKQKVLDATKEERTRIANLNKVPKWRKFELQQSQNFGEYCLLRYNAKTNRFETSKGIQIPALLGIHFYENCILGTCGDCLEFMGYRVNEVTNNHIIVGCHKVTIEEIKNVISVYNNHLSINTEEVSA